MNTTTLRVSALQFNLVWEDKAANIQAIEKFWNELPADRHLIVLPEMFSTGFSMRPSEFAETMDGATVQWMRKRAVQSGAYIAGSLIIQENDSYYNRLICVTPLGDTMQYDKRHLFSMAGEEQYYSAGKSRDCWNILGWRILPQICYDLRFPVWSRNDQDYDAVLYPANWPERRNEAWKTLLRARSIENQAYVVGVNRIGLDGNDVDHSGDSVILSPLGAALSELKPHQEGWLHAEWKREELDHVRKAFPFLRDRDVFSV